MRGKLATPHSQPIETCFEATASTPEGLSSAEAEHRLAVDGPNTLPTAQARGPWRRFFCQFHNILIYVLLGAALVTAALAHWVDTAVIVAVVLVNATIGYVQEGKAEAAMSAIRDLLAPRAAVLRDGRRQSVDAAAIVNGDIVLLEAGDSVPADLRVIDLRNVRVDEAILTGESVPVEKSLKLAASHSALGDRACMLFSGTMIATGTARGLVVATGRATEIGRISGLLQAVETLTTPLVRQMNVFARWLTAFILLISAGLLAFGYFATQQPFEELFMIIVGLAVAAIPEGLPAVLTITLAVGVQAMARRNAIIRRLPAIETIGSVSVVCTDKTGTLTRNEMAITRVALADTLLHVEADGYRPEGHVLDGHGVRAPVCLTLADIALVAGLCNDAELHEVEQGWRVEGDPMEGALRVLAAKIAAASDNSSQNGLPANWQRLDVVPFDSAHRYMAVLCRGPEQRTVVLVKGAPEAVIAMCVGQRTSTGASTTLDEAYWNGAIEALAEQGQRVIALAIREDHCEPDSLNVRDFSGQLTLLGLVGLIDPPRSEAIEAVAECRRAGVQVKMITGDHAATARAIAKQVGLGNPERVLTGRDLDQMDDVALAETVANVDIFARTSPEHKLRLVEALQGRGLTVAMTGDGVNDSPALKRADIGIAMGLKGSEAAKQSAELVLADDNFASIVAAIREGRRVYDNIQKVISWTLPTNAGEAMTIIAALLASLSLPITAVQILWVNLITAATLGIALAFEPIEAGTMQRPPRARNQPLLTGGLIWHIVLVSILFLAAVFGVYTYAIDKGHPDELARTMAMNTLVVLEIFHLFFIRNIYGTSFTWRAARGTPVIWACIAIVTTAQFAITYLPSMQAVFGTRAVPLVDGLTIVAVGALFFMLLEAEKQMRLAFVSSYRPDINRIDR
jgi:magnesium-transporting ATPase (P-type)